MSQLYFPDLRRTSKDFVLYSMPLIERLALLDSAPVDLVGQTRAPGTGTWKDVPLAVPRNALIVHSAWADRYTILETEKLIIPGMVDEAALRHVADWICAVGEQPLEPKGLLAWDLQVYKVLKLLDVKFAHAKFLKHILRYLKSGEYIVQEDAKVEDIMVMWENFSNDRGILHAVLSVVLTRRPDPAAADLSDIEVYICRNPNLLDEARAVYDWRADVLWKGFSRSYQQSLAQHCQ